MATVRIEDVQIILTQPDRSRLAIVKIMTSEPGLYGVGCATFTQRIFAVQAALEHHIKPFLIGRDVDRIEELWQMMMVHGYWRNGPVLNNAISGVDMALWDIKGKRAGMPVYQLLGGKCREAAAVYVHASGTTPDEVIASAKNFIAQGYHYIRVQLGAYGGTGSKRTRPEGSPDGAYFDPRTYMRENISMIGQVRDAVGPDIELLHDIHERLTPIDAIRFAKQVEPFDMFFLEDALAPEDNEWFAQIRQHAATPLAMGELYNNPHEWRMVIQNRWIDYIRVHISQIGGLSPARNLAIFSQVYGVKTAWHGPQDTSPVGHAANVHLDVWAPNFGIQEWYRPSELDYAMFPGLPKIKQGYLYPNELPGLGIDIDEKLAAEYPCKPIIEDWTQTRLPDGSPVRP
jgi:mannonate dehydratase